MNIRAGDVVMAHLSYKAISPVQGGVDSIIDAFLETLGPEGTLIFPTFTFSYFDTRKWDKEKSRSEMGVLTEHFRKREGVIRSFHPIYSFAAYGKKAEEFCSRYDENGVGSSSPFPLMIEYNAKQMAVGVGYNQAFTLGHHIEWREKVDYRYVKGFKGVATENGKDIQKEFSLLVRGEGILTDYRKWGYMLEKEGYMKVGRFGWAITRIIESIQFDKLTTDWLNKKVPNLMYKLDSDLTASEKELLNKSYYECNSFS